MSQSLSSLWTRLIFSTKDRFPFLKEPELKNDMHRYLASVLRAHDCETLIVGGTSDHVHALCTRCSIGWRLLTQGAALGLNLQTPSALVSEP